MLANGSGSAFEPTGKSNLTTISRGELCSERLQELKSVTPANNGVGVGGGRISVGVESGGENEQQLQLVKGDYEELLDVNGCGSGYSEQLYYDSLVRNKLPNITAKKASPRPATNLGSSARRLTTDACLLVGSDSDLYLSRPQPLAKDNNVTFASDKISALSKLSDTRMRSDE